MTPADETRKRGLGRGLSALLGDETEDYATLDRVRLSKTVPIELLHPGDAQPRRHFDDDAIAALITSIREKGVLQPLLVRRHPAQTNEYEIVAGERRWRAAQGAGLTEVPVVIKELDDSEALELALIENVQREDLTAVEEAEGYQRLMEEFGHTQEALSRVIGKSRSHIANLLRLLTLPDLVQEMVNDGRLSAGHARALINTEAPSVWAELIVARGLNVRQTEQMVKKSAAAGPKAALAPAARDPNIVALENDLSQLLGLKVSIKTKGEGGTLDIAYETLEQLDDVLHRLTHGKPPTV
ncbi:MAG: ParB/RepB/Spo0J family partition protein [Rhodospirillaceae bacterium]|nr:ParB/RepB/Spo0J family partition protein [Rhodospirillaceae bacterium]MDD9913611.1 ParB/RepB/Spo0J family partition protein [Rhodospirillaceae bacterium]MDD9925397.1 ParB/RepB/Spo0J family partition protein [Rhodospirillaceae bacterium]